MASMTEPVRAGELEALRRAVELAARGAGTVLPNPVVGCVVLDGAGSVVGEGFHQHVGGPHAEVAALAQAGERARGGTAVVTLEPCDHTGRTGPCTHALIAAGIARVVFAVRDPWDTASGGASTLRAAGVDVLDLAGTESACGAEDVNRVWLTSMRNFRPFVTWKSGMTIDGRVAAADGSSRWITSPESRADAHRLRGEVDTMMVGVGTVLADDPALTARNSAGELVGRQPLRVVIDSSGRTPSTAKVLDSSAETLVATTGRFGATPDGRVDLAAVLRRLFQDGRRHVLLEGGPVLATSALDAGLVDEVLVYVAPLALGAGRSALDGGAVSTLAGAHRLELCDVQRLGPDVRLRYRVLSIE